MPTTLTKAREFVNKLIKQRETGEAETATQEMRQHLDARESGRKELVEAKKHNDLVLSQFETTKSVWRQKSAEQLRLEKEASFEAAPRRRQLRSDIMDLLQVIHRGPQLHNTERIEDELVATCQDEELQLQLEATTGEREDVQTELGHAESEREKVWERLAKARRRRLETLEEVRSHFGPEGEKWSKSVASDGDVTIESVKRQGVDGVHPDNLAHFNAMLAGPNGAIQRDAKIEFDVEEIQATLDQLTENIATIRQAMIESEI